MRATDVAERALATSAAIRYRTIRFPLVRRSVRPPADNDSLQSIVFLTSSATAMISKCGFRIYRTMLKLESVAAFVSVVEAGSIVGAARRLGISKSVVSERLTELERVLGTRFIQRTTRKLSLTQDGNAFYGRARQILRDVDSAAAEGAQRRGTLIG